MRREHPTERGPVWRQALAGVRVLVLLALASAVSACGATTSQPGGPMAAMASMSGDVRTVAFESVDGPPPQVFDRFVQILESESQTRNVAVVSRAAAANYHVRGYLAAQLHGGRTVIAWVWDVYDRDQQRVLRLSGEEDAGKAGRDAWALADAALLRRIAQSGLISLSGFVNGTAPTEAPGRAGPAIASLTEPAVGSDSAALAFSAR